MAKKFDRNKTSFDSPQEFLKWVSESAEIFRHGIKNGKDKTDEKDTRRKRTVSRNLPSV